MVTERTIQSLLFVISDNKDPATSDDIEEPTSSARLREYKPQDQVTIGHTNNATTTGTTTINSTTIHLAIDPPATAAEDQQSQPKTTDAPETSQT